MLSVAAVTLGQIHFVLATGALISGGATAVLRKGDGIHRLVGSEYAAPRLN